MNSEDAFLQSIHENPDDDNLRRIFADWLEERGDERAEYLRLRCELMAIPKRMRDLRQHIDHRWLLAASGRVRAVLVSFEAGSTINLIRLIRECTGLGLPEARDVIWRAPSTIKDNIPLDEAERIQNAFRPYAKVVLEAREEKYL